MAVINPHAPDEQVQAVLSLHELGWTSTKISEQTDIPATTIREWLNSSELVAKHNAFLVQERRRLAARSIARVDAMLEEAEAGERRLSVTETMIQYGVAQDKHLADLKIAAAAEAPLIQRGPFVIFMGQSVQELSTEAKTIEATVTSPATVTVLPPAPAPDTKAEPDPEP